MSSVFDPHQGLIVVQAEIRGPSGSAVLRLALDTGATINAGMLVSIGYNPALSPDRVQVTTGSGIEFAPVVNLNRLRALEQERTHFSALCHTLPLVNSAMIIMTESAAKTIKTIARRTYRNTSRYWKRVIYTFGI